MSIGDFFLKIIGSFLKIGDFFPQEISFFTPTDLGNLLDSIHNFWVYSFSFASQFFPFLLFFSLLLLILTMELALFVFRIVKFVINLFRGSGA